MRPFFIHHHHHAQGDATGIFPRFEQAGTRYDVNALQEQVDAFPSCSLNGGRDATFNGEAGLVPVKDGFAAASSRKGRPMQSIVLLLFVSSSHDLSNGVGGHDAGEPCSSGNPHGRRGFTNARCTGDDEQPWRTRREGLGRLLSHPYPLGHAVEVQG